VRITSVFGDSWERELGDLGFRVRWSRVAAALGAELLGASVYEIEPGQRGMPYHVHHANEELLLLLRGAVSVRTPDGEVALKEGDLMLFRRGRPGVHQVINRSDDVARYLVVSTRIDPEVAEFPDTGKTMFTRDRETMSSQRSSMPRPSGNGSMASRPDAA
jgi:uncharacterized cupin superfamily protein